MLTRVHTDVSQQGGKGPGNLKMMSLAVKTAHLLSALVSLLSSPPGFRPGSSLNSRKGEYEVGGMLATVCRKDISRLARKQVCVGVIFVVVLVG